LSPGLSDGELRALDSRDSQNFVARTAALSGDVVLSAQASVFFSCVLDAGESTISVGDNSNIQDNTWIRCDSDRVAIGRDTTLGHNVDVRDCTIGNRCLIGIGSVLTAGTIVEDDVLLAAGSTTVPSQRLSSGFLWAGRPARSLSKLDDSKREMMRLIVEQYCGYANAFREVQQQSR
jgi:carbonic anhydrase/acetyltransferase-like protein (isoleucine patch superfamily)